MKFNIGRIDRCEKCGREDEYVVRDGTVNSILKDSDIFKIISSATEQTQSFDYCETCDMRTLTTVIAFSGT